eukprot:CAMPEP_0113618516 /NCGR_PEP_ID=MMETSP0017_2-20120614/9377_1 /TAXON_ID=2856 /ORGANISM="Cylindrotheca closterium" /LENGTH=403 /DNA_ID=CAMNT_0000528027 /DNA_START=337 /DNA_END=1548 /DNA_ORIENTATION=+ /assembly_acc=CAM_ASM_000147
MAAMLWALAECRIGNDAMQVVRELQGNAERQVVYLLQFDIRLALDGAPEDVNIYTLRQIVTSWLDDSYKAKSENDSLLSSGATFDYVALDFVTRRQLQESIQPTNFYKAVFRGFTVWNLESADTEAVNSDFVELIQKATLLEDKRLLDLLRQAGDGVGLGSSVLDVRSELSTATDAGAGDGADDSATDETLEIIIMIAIIVACLAFCLLMFAVIWAWRSDRAKREAYKASRREQRDNNMEKTGRPAAHAQTPPPKQQQQPPMGMAPPAAAAPTAPPASARAAPPQEIPGHSNYPDSVISDSVITDSVVSNGGLDSSYTGTGYSMPHQAPPAATAPSAKFEPRELNDAASMSSMDSYGYSLDGYASSLGGPPKFPGGALGGMPSEPNDASDADLAPSLNGDRKI